MVGYGRIGQRTAELGAAFGMRILAYDPVTSAVRHPDVVLTPHLMGLSRRATAATFTAAARGVLDVLAGREPQAVANPAWRTHRHEGDPPMTSFADKIAGAPISWGVCEVPGWGYQLPPERVLAEMQQVGLAATEFGPDGFLPADPAVMAELLAARHLTAVGGFTPVVLHEPSHDPVPGIDRLLDGYDAVPRRRARAVRRHRPGRLRYPS